MKKPEVRDYTGIVPNTPPEGGEAWIEEHGGWEKEYIIYRAGKWEDPITGISGKCVDAVCTKCKARMKLDYVAGPSCAAYAHTPFGFRLWEGETFRGYGTDDRCQCPECGAEATAQHIGGVNKYLGEYRWWMTVSAIPENGGKKSLCLSFWLTEKSFDKEGNHRFFTVPWEAYIFDQWGRTVRLAKWQAGMYGQMSVCRAWRQNRTPKDVIRDVRLVYGDIAAVLPGTSCQESKLNLYMTTGNPFPVSYMHIWQKHQQAEAIITSGGGALLGGILEREKSERIYNGYSGYSIQKYNNEFAKLENCDWKKRRPCEILRMNAEEYRTAMEKGMSGDAMENWVKGKAAGMALRLPEDMEALSRYSWLEICRIHDAGVQITKALRYMERQKEKYRETAAEITVNTLLDFWELSGENGEKWPQNLKRAHDQALLHKKFKEQEKLRGLFAARYAHCKKYEYEADGLMILAPEAESDLIREGKLLSHCVASYAERHAKGEITVLFVRRAEAPEVPFYTLSFYEKNGNLCMNHGLRNCQETDEVKAFREKWETWRNAGCRRKEAKSA